MKKIHFFATLCFSVFSLFSFGNNIKPLLNVIPEKVSYSNFTSIPSSVYFAPGKELEFSQVTSFLANYFEGKQIFSLRLVGQESDELGFVHYRYQQLVDNIPVSYAYYVVHTKNTKVVSMHGLLFDRIGSSLASINNTRAFELAKEYVSAKTYMWDNQLEENLLKRQTSDPQATYLPIPELQYVVNPSHLDYPVRLGYQITIYASDPLSKQAVFVDALDGKILYSENLLHFKDVKGVANTVYSGVQTITTDSSSLGYILRESGRGNGIETYSMKNGKDVSVYEDFIDKNNVWDTINVQKDQYAVDAHWGAEKTYDYFFQKHARNSIDGKGYKLVNMLHYGVLFGNALWDGKRMLYGDGDNVNTKNPVVSLDIIGHEITHGLTSNTAKLVGQNEPGALNESFSDIFGATIDWYARPDKANWKVGDEVSPIFRSLEDPSSTKHPDTYKGEYWIPDNGIDYGGVHSNNGVQNYWYYLLVQGGSGTNDLGKTYSVKGIGIEKAAAIVYRNLTVYMTSLSTFQDARLFSIQSAVDLFGFCSPEVESVTNAWYAVGVGEAYSSKITASFTAEYTKNCFPFKVRFVQKTVSNQALDFEWLFGDSTTSMEKNPTHEYSQAGTYEVTFKAKSKEVCLGRDSLAIIKQVIEFDVPKPIITKVCEKDSVFQLQASIPLPLGWYTSDTSSVAIDTLSSLNLQNPLKDTIFYLKTRKPAIDTSWRVGIKDLSSNTGYIPGTERCLIFDVSSPVTLKSVLVNASEGGIRIIELRTESGVILASKSVSLSTGENRVQLDFELIPGVNYQLGLGGTLGKLLRTNAGVSYPYTIENVLSIKGSNAIGGYGLSYYYFFYDWEVVEYRCTELAQPYHVKQTICASLGVPSTSLSGVTIFPNPSTGLIQLSNLGGRSVQIIDVLGNLLIENNVGSETWEVNLSSWSSGVYLIQISNPLGVEVVRLVKE